MRFGLDIIIYHAVYVDHNALELVGGRRIFDSKECRRLASIRLINIHTCVRASLKASFQRSTTIPGHISNHHQLYKAAK